jgi:4-amino-4-deoxy-L-arabinose transferase and related glycosyltransferases of PMT family
VIDPLEGQGEGSLPRWLVIACLIGVFLLAGLLRARQLGVSVYGDEAYHFVAADREAAGKGITLAPNFPYRRGLWFTETVIASRRWFGDSEWAHRLPAFVASLGSVLLVFAIGARWFDPLVGLVAALIVALDRDSVFFGSYARFYSAAQLLSLLAVYAFDHAFRTLEGPLDRRAVLLASGWACVFFAALAAALQVQILSASVLLGAGVFLLGRALFRRFGDGRRDWMRWPESWLLSAGAVLGLLATLVYRPSGILEVIRHVPLWNVREGASPFYYTAHLRAAYPFEFILSAVGLAFASRRWPRGAGLLVCFFLPAFLVHSLLPQKVIRYIFLLVPFFLILAACGYTFMWSQLRALRTGPDSRAWSWLSAAIVLGAICLSPSAVRGGKGDRGPAWVDWRAAVKRVHKSIAPQDAVVGGVADDMFAIEQYTHVDAHACTPEWWRYRLMDVPAARVNVAGPYAIPCLSTVEQFQALARQHGRVWIFLRSDHLTSSESQIAPRDTLQELVKIGERRSRPFAEVTILLLEAPR